MQQTLFPPEDVEGKPHGLQKVRLKKTSRLNRLQDVPTSWKDELPCAKEGFVGEKLFSSVFQSFSIFLFY